MSSSSSSSFFTDIEEVAYSMVEYIPVLGTLYSYTRAYAAHTEGDKVKLWQSVVNALQGSIRDVIVATATEEIAAVAIVHTMGESLTDKVIEVSFSDSEEKKVKKHKYVLVHDEKSEDEIFKGKAKGVHLFHDSFFVGKLLHTKLAPSGVEAEMHIPYGLYDGAPVSFSWVWTVDTKGIKNRPEKSWGLIQLVQGTPTRFVLSKSEGKNEYGPWAGYDIKGKILSKDKIIAQVTIHDENIEIVFERKPDEKYD